MYNKKGQAAMEFLMTYGWAILAAIIAIGVLAYFGVFSPGKYAPTATVINAPLYATGVKAGMNSTGAFVIQLEIKNNGGEVINVTKFDVTGSIGSNSITCSGFPGAVVGAGLIVDVGAVGTASAGCTNTSGVLNGQIFKGDIAVTYIKGSGSLGLTSTGTMTEKVTP